MSLSRTLKRQNLRRFNHDRFCKICGKVFLEEEAGIHFEVDHPGLLERMVKDAEEKRRNSSAKGCTG